MARYIDAEPIVKNLKSKIINPQTSFINTVLIGLLDKAPTADVVEVVFCKDCKHYTNIDTYRNPPRLDFHWCNKFGNITKEKDYCSYGERKIENG